MAGLGARFVLPDQPSIRDPKATVADVIAAGERREGGVSGIALSLRSINRTGFGTLAGGHSTQYSSLANSLMHIPEQPNVRRRFSQKWSCFLGVEQHSRDTHKAYLRHTF